MTNHAIATPPGQKPKYVKLTKAELAAKKKADAEFESAKRAAEYAALRRDAYPPITDQLDALWHAGLFPKEMAAKIAAVKKRYPKPVAE